MIHNSTGERVVGADNCKVNLFGNREIPHRRQIGNRQWCIGRSAAIPGKANDLANSWRLMNFPSQRVLASASSDDQDFHCADRIYEP
jgi:hypothetical protein